MSVYWTIYRIPEVKGISSEKRDSLIRACYPRASREKPVRLAMFACSLSAAVGTVAAAYSGFGAPIFHLFLRLFVGAFIGGAIGGLIFGVVLANQIRPFLREALTAESPSMPSQGGRSNGS